ncbi:MAG: V/A-type H+/Na+-transporting ATPase subunit [Clostridiales bacterium]|jgi:V/A-type H+-transporting ATPase subunit F|nr:V/A-type H+/Na+-transporting ATPase subunit [Clostridiales bacterium]
MYKVGVIGDRDSVIGFRAIGMAVYDTEDIEMAGDYLRQMVRENYAVVFITEKLAEGNMNLIRELRNQKLPAVIPVPSITGSTGLGMKQVRESVRKAVGIDLFAESDSLQSQDTNNL